MNKYFNYSDDLVPGTTARSDSIDASLEAIEAGLDVLEADVFRTIRFTDGATPVEADFQISETPAQRSNKTLGFDVNGMPSVLADAGSWEGDWATATAYLVKAIVRGPVANSQSIYICQVAHTSSDFATDLAAGRWALMIDLGPIERSTIKHTLYDDTDSPISAAAGDDLMLDVTNGPIDVILPASPLITDAPINIMHVDGDLSTNVITIQRNGNLIMSLDEDMTVLVTNASFGLAFCDAARGWRVRGV